MRKGKTVGKEGGLWTIVLAAEAATPAADRTASSVEGVPLQFCTAPGGVSSLHSSLHLAGCLVPERRVRVVVSRDHRRWWQWHLADLLISCAVEQPHDRGTAASILLALTPILRHDPEATVVVLPASYRVEDELVLYEALAAATASAREQLSRILLLGMTSPVGRGAGREWLVPQRRTPPFGVSQVVGLHADPEAEEEAALGELGALASSSILVARGSTLRALFEQHLPALALPFCFWSGDTPSLAGIFDSISGHDFMRDLLPQALERLSVVAVPPCGWTDLTRPERPERAPAASAAVPGSTRWQPAHSFTPRPELLHLFAGAQRTA